MSNTKPTAMEHYDNVSLASLMLNKCQTLFVAIGDKAKTDDSGRYIFSQIKELAEIGQELAFDWVNTFEIMADDLEKHVKEERNGK